MNNELTIALAKGRLGKQALELLKQANYGPTIDISSRKLIFKDDKTNTKYMLVKPSDVITYVINGIADVGIVGSDTIMEQDKHVYEILDLPIGKCKFCLAGPADIDLAKKPVLKIATKYPHITKNYFKNTSQQIELFYLNGSVELAPLVGLSDIIADIVETGNTLRANGLEVLNCIEEVNAKLIVNPASYRLEYDNITQLKTRLNKVIQDDSNS